MSTGNSFGSRTFGEVTTGGSQAVEFSCRSEDVEKVKAFFKEHIHSVSLPTTSRVNVAHGGYGRYTRYDITQHKYAGGGHPGFGGFIEVLEIKNPPENRQGIVIYDFHESNGSCESFFTEWETLESALEAFEKCWGSRDAEKKLAALPGFKRSVTCGVLSPWFYAIGEEVLLGDYAFPDGFQDDPVFRFGEKFVVMDMEGVISIKTCMGTRFTRYKNDDHRDSKEQMYRLVYWDDGSVWDERHQFPWWSNSKMTLTPRPLLEGELWVTEAVAQFNRFLSGHTKGVSIDFINGDRFVGKLVKRRKKKELTTAGSYYAVVNVVGEKKAREGWVKDFRPTRKTPDIVSHLKSLFEARNLKVRRIHIKEFRFEKGGKKWSGVFFDGP